MSEEQIDQKPDQNVELSDKELENVSGGIYTGKYWICPHCNYQNNKRIAVCQNCRRPKR